MVLNSRVLKRMSEHCTSLGQHIVEATYYIYAVKYSLIQLALLIVKFNFQFDELFALPNIFFVGVVFSR